MSNTVLQVEDLTVSYPSPRGRFRAVDGVSFTIHQGETFGLVGESGSGKTTTAMAILTMIKPLARVEHGRILLEGIDLLAQRGEALRRLRWSRLSFITQGAENALNPVMKITDQIGVGAGHRSPAPFLHAIARQLDPHPRSRHPLGGKARVATGLGRARQRANGPPHHLAHRSHD
jgi:ABC-type glutathione transport system ATPase component